MADISPRRRWAGRAALVTGLLALPLTASFTYATPSIALEASDPGGEEETVTVVIRDVDPDAEPLTEAQVERIEREAEAAAEKAEEIADKVEKEMRFVFVKDGRIVTERAIELQAGKIDEAMARFKADGREVSVRMDLGELRKVDASKLAKLEELGKDMEKLRARIETDPEWQANMKKLQELALQMTERQMPALLEMQREFAKSGLIKTCTINGEEKKCAEIDMSRLQQEALAEARRDIAENEDLTPEQRKRALAAIDNALSED